MAGNDYVNLSELTYDAINAIKKKGIVDYIEKMKGKVVADKQMQNLCKEKLIFQRILKVSQVPMKDSPVNW